MSTYPVDPPGAPSYQGWLDSAADRRMCAGTYLDPDFRDHVLRDVYNNRGRRVAPSYGYNVVLVLRHAWRAWWLETCQHLFMLVVLGLALAFRPLDALAAVDVLVIWHLLRRWVIWAVQYNGYGDQRNPLLLARQLQFRGKLLKFSLSSSLITLLVLVVAAAHQGGIGPWPVHAVLCVAGMVFVLAAIVAVTAALRVICLGRLRASARGARRLSRRMGVIDRQQRHPFIVYAGYKPFIGSGNNIRSWSFAQRLVHADHSGIGPGLEFSDPPFTAQKLVDRLRERISALKDESNPETRLPGLHVTDRVFVEGTLAGRFNRALASDPESGDVERAIAEAIARPSDVARHYLAARVESWAGEIVTSVFVHVSLQGRTLYLEFATYALLPTRPEFHVVDEIGGTGGRAIARAVRTGLACLPQQLLAARRLAHAPVQLRTALRPGRDRTPKASLRADIGAMSCARETAMAGADGEPGGETEGSYFQFQDVIQHSKIIERRLIAAVDDYLKDVGVDTSEFVQRAMAILNSGVINTGSGTVNVVNSAVGDQPNVNIQTEIGES